MHKCQVHISILMLILFICLTGHDTPKEDIPGQTSDMLTALSELERAAIEMKEYEDLVYKIFSNKKYQKQAEPLITAFLRSDKNYAGKRWLYHAIKNTNTPAAHEFMAEMLSHDNAAYLALMVLQDIPDPEVNKLLKKSFPGASHEIQVGILNVLGLRRDANSVEFLIGYMHNENRQLAHAAISALGNTGTPETIKVLTDALVTSGKKDQSAVMEALMVSAEQLFSTNQPDPALEIYNSVLDADPPDMIALAAISGVLNTTSRKPSDILKGYITGTSEEFRYKLIDLMHKLPESYLSGREFLQLPGLTDEEKLRMITVLSEREDKSIDGEVKDYIHSENREFRDIAINAFSRIADADDILFLVELASASRGEQKELARNAIYTMRGSGIDSHILENALNSEDELATEYIMAIGERNIQGADEVLFQAAKSDNAKIRLEALKAMETVASTANLDKVAELLLDSKNRRERRQLEKTLSVLAIRSTDGSGPTTELIEYLNEATDPTNKSSLINVLGEIKNPHDVGELLNYIEDDEIEVQLSAIRSLSDWPNKDPLDGFKKLILESVETRVRTLSFRGLTQVLLNDRDSPDEKKVEELEFGMSQAQTDSENKLLISALGKIVCFESFSLLIDEMADPGDLRPELEAALSYLAQELIEYDEEKTRSELERLAPFTENEEILQWLEPGQK